MAKQFIRCVRGDSYGVNSFVNNSDGTVTDNASGLMWSQSDSASTMNWREAPDSTPGWNDGFVEQEIDASIGFGYGGDFKFMQ